MWVTFGTSDLESSPLDSLKGFCSGKGLFWGVEFVKNKETKEPFPNDFPLADLLAEESIRLGAVIYPGMKGAVG